MQPPASVAAPRAQPHAIPESFPLLTLLALYLVPGMLLVAFSALCAPLLQRAGLPLVWGLLLGTLVVIVPVELGTLLWWGKRASGRYTLRGVISYTEPLAVRQYLWLVPCAILGAFLLPGLVVLLEPLIRSTLFGWLPAWFSAGLGGISSYSTGIQIGTAALWIITAVLSGPVVEELYFRGFLMPRTAGGGRWAPALNAVLFALYHFWQPYAFFTITLFVLPLAYLVWWRRNIAISMIAHCTINLITFVSLFVGIVQR